MISLKEIFETKVEDIWNDEKFEAVEIKKFGYAVQDNQSMNSLLFVGINPSNPTENSERVFYQNEKEGMHKYFRKFLEISEQTNLPWSHIDLLYVRKTRQDVVSHLLYKGDDTTIEFFKKQLEISKEMLEYINPEIIVVNNTLARTLLGYDGEGLKYEFKFDDRLGTHVIISKDSKLFGKPVFFTSMLTGQRALDKGSYERLIWHINYVIKILSIKI